MAYSYIEERTKLTPVAASGQNSAARGKGENDPIAVPCTAYQEMQPHWAVIDAVKGGTSHMRECGQMYLPMEPMEEADAHARRLKKATLTPLYVRLVRGLIGMVLRKPLALDVSKRVKSQLDDVNLLGDDINSFAREVFESAIDYGYTGLFVDYTRVEGVHTLAEEAAIAPRPYWIHYTAAEIIGFRYRMIGNRRVFTQLRIHGHEMQEDGEFGEKQVETIKVYDLVELSSDGSNTLERGVTWRLYELTETDWVQVDGGTLSVPFIPFTFIHTNKKKAIATQPPMLELAYLNIKHFQISADLEHSLHLAANPKLCLFGYDINQGDVIASVDEALIFENTDGRAEWIAPPERSFAPHEVRLDKIERQMGEMGLSSLISQKRVAESAEAKQIDRIQGDSMMAVTAQGLQDALDLCLEYHAAYLKEPAGTCQVNRNFDVSGIDPQAIAAFSNLHLKSQISLETLLELLKNGEVFGDEFSIADELKRLEAEFNKETATAPAAPIESLMKEPVNEL